MNKLLLIYCLLLTPISGFSQPEILFHLPFNDSLAVESTFAFRIAPHGNIDFTVDRNGIPCKAVNFDGRSYLEISNNAAFNKITRAFSMTGWFKFDEVMNPDTWLTILCKGQGVQETSSNPHFRVQVFQNPRQSTVSINTDFTEYDLSHKNHLFKPKEWFFYSLSYDGTHVRTYLNGNEIWNYPYSGNLKENNSSLFIGLDTPGATEYFHGSMDDLKLFSTSLSEREILKLYKTEDKNSSSIKSGTCPKNQHAYIGNSECGTEVEYDWPSNNSCHQGGVKLLEGLRPGSKFPIGRTVNILEIRNNQNVKICKSEIIVHDTIRPRIEAIKDTLIKTSTSCWNQEELPVTARDECGFIPVNRIDSLRNQNCLPAGQYRFKYMAIDESGNSIHHLCNVIIKSTDPKPKGVPIPSSESLTYKDNLDFKSKRITVTIYDNKAEDKDRISIYYNDVRIIENSTIKNKENEIIRLVIELDRNRDNVLVIQALNLGRLGKNTCKVDFYSEEVESLDNHKPLYSKVYNTRPGFASAIKLNLIKN